MVEFAVVIPVLLVIVLGIIDWGRFLNYAQQETTLAGQAVRNAAVAVNPGSGASQTLQVYTASQASGGLNVTSGDVVSKAAVYIYYPTGSSNTVGQSIRACVVATVTLLPYLGGTNITITQAATMRIEVQNSSVFTTDTRPAACPA